MEWMQPPLSVEPDGFCVVRSCSDKGYCYQYVCFILICNTNL